MYMLGERISGMLCSMISKVMIRAILLAQSFAFPEKQADNWSSAFPEITDRPDILGSLYNLGHTNNDGTPRKPHSNPQANWFGEKTKMYYGLMPYLLGE